MLSIRNTTSQGGGMSSRDLMMQHHELDWWR
jgi:hypothetical protein